MKTLTLWQPWASLVAFGEKKVETRCWQTKHRGAIAIHAAAKEPPSGLGLSRNGQRFVELFNIATERHGWEEFYWPISHWKPIHEERVIAYRAGEPVISSEELQAAHGFGAILCVADLVAIEPTDKVRGDLAEQELLFGNYEDGRYAWFLENVRRLQYPVPAKGHQQLWNWSAPNNLSFA